MVLMKLFRLQSDSNDFSIFYQLQLVVFLPLLTLIPKKVILSLKVIKLLHSKISSNFYPVNNLFSPLDKSLNLLCLCFLSCKSWENHNDPTWGSPKSTLQAVGVMYRKESLPLGKEERHMKHPPQWLWQVVYGLSKCPKLQFRFSSKDNCFHFLLLRNMFLALRVLTM